MIEYTYVQKIKSNMWNKEEYFVLLGLSGTVDQGHSLLTNFRLTFIMEEDGKNTIPF
jgi:hypothetical protein